MPLLQVRDCPENIYTQLAYIAKKEHRTIAQQTLVFVEKAMGEAAAIEASREQRKKLMAKILSAPIPKAAKLLDPAALVRKDRDR